MGLRPQGRRLHGAALAVLGQTGVLAGAPGKDTAAGADVGAAYLFDGTRLLRTLSNPTPEPGDRFGSAITAVGRLVAVSSPFDDAAGVDAGALIAIDTDVHSAADFDQLRYGVLTARRGWLTPDRCVNAWPQKKLLAWLRSKR